MLKSRLFLMLALALCLAGCVRDPKVRAQKLIDSGEKYMERAKYEEASIQFRRAAQADPNSAEAYYRLGSVSLKLAHWQEAYRSLQRAIELDPKHVKAQLELARLEAAAQQFDKARSLITTAQETDPNNIEGYLLQGSISLREKNYAQALAEFKQAQSVASGDARPLTGMGDAYLLLKRYPEAVSSYQEAIHQDAHYLPAYLNLSQVWRSEKNGDAEVETLQACIQTNPKAIQGYMMLAASYVAQKTPDKLPALFAQLRSATSDAPDALVAIGDFDSRIGDTENAKSLFALALKKEPNNRNTRKRLIQVELARQEWDEAERLNGELLKIDRRDPEARLAQARLQFIRGAKAGSINSLEHLVHDVPEMELAHFYLGLAYADQGQPARAIASLNQSIAQDANFLPAYVKLGELYLQQNDAKLALSLAQQALDRNPVYPPAVLLRANALVQAGEYASATDVLKSLEGVLPQSPVIAERLGAIAVREKRWAEAETSFEEALHRRPGYIPALMELISVYEQQHRSSEAVARVQQEIRSVPSDSNLYELLGGVYLNHQEYADAEGAFQRALQLNAHAQAAHMQLARLFAAEQKLDQAIASARAAVDDNKDNYSAQMLLASLYEQDGKIPDAEAAYEKLLQRSPDYAYALNNLAWLYCEHGGNLDVALSMAQKAKAELPNDARVSDTLAWIQYRKGLYSVASKSLEELTQNSPQNATYEFHLGMSMIGAGNYQEGKVALQRALSLKLPSDLASQARNALTQGESRAM